MLRLLQAAACHMGVELCCPDLQHIHIIALFYHLHPLLLLLLLLLPSLGFFFWGARVFVDFQNLRKWFLSGNGLPSFPVFLFGFGLY